MLKLDLTLTQWINAAADQSGGLDLIMVFMAVYGLPLLIAGVALLWWMPGSRIHARHTCIVATIAFCASLLANQVLLLFIHRIRPYEVGLTHLIIRPSSDWAFPSDHATATFAILGTLWFRRIRWPLAIGVPLGLLICVARVYVGVHYVSDIVGGICIGLGFSGLAVRFYPAGTWPFQDNGGG